MKRMFNLKNDVAVVSVLWVAAYCFFAMASNGGAMVYLNLFAGAVLFSVGLYQLVVFFQALEKSREDNPIINRVSNIVREQSEKTEKVFLSSVRDTQEMLLKRIESLRREVDKTFGERSAILDSFSKRLDELSERLWATPSKHGGDEGRDQ